MRFATTMLAVALLFAGTSYANETDAEAERKWFKKGGRSFRGKGSAFGRLNDKFASKLDDIGFDDDDYEEDHDHDDHDDEEFLSSYGVSVPHKSDYESHSYGGKRGGHHHQP